MAGSVPHTSDLSDLHISPRCSHTPSWHPSWCCRTNDVLPQTRQRVDTEKGDTSKCVCACAANKETKKRASRPSSTCQSIHPSI
mmetsp:Transcript_15320/g.43765  ORF Transcript_15320/g.43765 Transcript_15320/m.43765 type:complete len:84 (-) Transcript_15320:213-464(-)